MSELMVLILSALVGSFQPADAAPVNEAAVKVAFEKVCDASQRIDENQKRMERENEIGKASGVVDKDVLYRAGRGIVQGRQALKEAVGEFKREKGRAFNGDDIMKCDYFSP